MDCAAKKGPDKGLVCWLGCTQTLILNDDLAVLLLFLLLLPHLCSRRADIKSGMSAFGGKADLNHDPAECPLLAISGHSGLVGGVPPLDDFENLNFQVHGRAGQWLELG